MLLAASPHPRENPDIHDALATLPEEMLGSPAVQSELVPPDVIFRPVVGPGVTPAHPIHTPQQLAQLEAIAQAQTRGNLDISTVPDQEKYLAAKLVYLASQYHVSEYNRQKVNNPTPLSIYVPLSIQLPNHIRDLRVRQAESTRRQAWFLAARKDRPDDSPRTQSDSTGETDGQLVEDTLPAAPFSHGRETPRTEMNEELATPAPLQTPPHLDRPSFFHPRTVEVALLQDALGNSVLPAHFSSSAAGGDSAKLSPLAMSVLSTPSFARILPSSIEVDVVDTPPPLPETALPQLPPPARSRVPSQNMVPPSPRPPVTPFSAASYPYTWLVGKPAKEQSPAISAISPLPPSDHPLFWPTPPTLPAPIHVAPTPSLQLQLALETAISKDTILTPQHMHPTTANGQHPVGNFDSFGSRSPMDPSRSLLYSTQPYGSGPGLGPGGAGNLPVVFMPPRLAPPKTSETHPINISQVIPPDCLPMISAHLERYPPNDDGSESEKYPRASYFRISPHYRLDRVIYVLAARAFEARAAMGNYSPVPVRVRFSDEMPNPRPMPSPSTGVRLSLHEPSFDRPLKRPFIMTSPVPSLSVPHPKRMESSSPGGQQGRHDYAPNSLSLDLRGNAHTSSDAGLENTNPFEVDNGAAPNGSEPPANKPPMAPLSNAPSNSPTRSPIALPMLSTTSHPSPVYSLVTPQQPFPPFIGSSSSNGFLSPNHQAPSRPNNGFVLGNLYMSSCPGKKVRLNGPIKGRGAICRDLGVDLARIKSIGVDLIICCLDNDEMEFLGAPWPEYEDAGSVVGLDILRLPMPEGLCPLSVQAMSIHMDRVIQNYTLQGRHVLVHCRGGVGRAGLVACSWMLKLGLVGSVEPVPEQDRTAWDFDGQLSAGHLMHGHQVPADALELLERVVYIIRRQRSVKAIETYEQVRFLLEFIEHLRTLDAQALST